jgi:hypothetical protein
VYSSVALVLGSDCQHIKVISDVQHCFKGATCFPQLGAGSMELMLWHRPAGDDPISRQVGPTHTPATGRHLPAAGDPFSK